MSSQPGILAWRSKAALWEPSSLPVMIDRGMMRWASPKRLRSVASADRASPEQLADERDRGDELPPIDVVTGHEIVDVLGHDE